MKSFKQMDARHFERFGEFTVNVGALLSSFHLFILFLKLKILRVFSTILQIIVKPDSDNGLILYSGHHEYGDYISLSLNDGFAEFAFELGSGPAVVR